MSPTRSATAKPGRSAFPGRFAAPAQALALALLLAGCAATEPLQLPEPLRAPKPDVATEAEALAATRPTRERERIEPGLTVAPRPYRSMERSSLPGVRAGEPISLTLDAVDLTQFINEVFGTQLGFSLDIDQAIRGREDLVSLRIVEPEPPDRLFTIAVEVLKRYGVRVQDADGVLRFVLSEDAGAEPPLVVTGRALPNVPAGQRPVFVLMPLNVSEPGRIGAHIRALFGGQAGLQVAEMPDSSAIMVSGPPASVEAALESIRMLDRVALRDKLSLRINPLFLNAEVLAKELREVLVAQGYSVRTGPGSGGVLTLVPVPSANALILFSESEEAMAAAAHWAEELDQPSDEAAGEGGVYLYAARHTTAESLRPVIESLVAGVEGNSAVVDERRNTIIFQGDPQRWRGIQSVLARLDQPARQVLIEVTVAEVTLGDEISSGVEWALQNVGIGSFRGALTTLSGTQGNAGGIVFSPISPSGRTRAVLNAFASSSRVSILSTPRLLVRSGETARIEVGTEVPIITSQATAPDLNQPGSILQQVQFRKTGVILEIDAVIHSGQRVDLTVGQEVSEAQVTDTSEISSPSIFSRRLETALSLSDGETMLLGGLISSSRTRGRTQVPGLGRIPVLGKLFQSNRNDETRTELLVLITPYVIEDATQARQITEAVRARFGGQDQ